MQPLKVLIRYLSLVSGLGLRMTARTCRNTSPKMMLPTAPCAVSKDELSTPSWRHRILPSTAPAMIARKAVSCTCMKHDKVGRCEDAQLAPQNAAQHSSRHNTPEGCHLHKHEAALKAETKGKHLQSGRFALEVCLVGVHTINGSRSDLIKHCSNCQMSHGSPPRQLTLLVGNIPPALEVPNPKE